MSQLMDVKHQRRDEILCQAAERQVQAVISHRLDNGWTTYKSRILQADAAEGFVILQHPEPGPGQAPPELAPGEQIGVSFRRGHKKCLCSAHIELLTSFKLSDGQAVAALQIPWPEELQEIQRRVYYRAEVPAGRRIEVAVWDGGILDRNQAELRDAPHHTGLLLDISGGGCRVSFEPSRDPQLQSGDTIGIRFQPDPRSEPIFLDAVFRHVEDNTRSNLALGFQFVGLETTSQGRQMLQALSRVVSTFLRIDARRKQHRLHRNKRRRQ